MYIKLDNDTWEKYINESDLRTVIINIIEKIPL